MRWRLVDRIEACEPWTVIRGRKVVSFEECWLPGPAGPGAECPRLLIVESLVELGRWLVAWSSGFAQTGVLAEAADLRLADGLGPGTALALEARVVRQDEATVEFAVVAAGPAEVVAGGLALSLLPLAEWEDPARVRARWEELHGQA